MSRHKAPLSERQARSPLRRCSRCSNLITWSQSASGRWVPLNATDQADHRDSCAGHPGRIRKVMAAMVTEAREASRAECASGAL
jgi:hypothetical protein